MEKITYKGIVFYKPDYDNVVLYRSRTSSAIRKHILIKKPCEVCGREKSVAHHEKYSDFLNVRWLCYKHHKIVHVLIAILNNKIIWQKYLNKHPNSMGAKISVEICNNELLIRK